MWACGGTVKVRCVVLLRSLLMLMLMLLPLQWRVCVLNVSVVLFCWPSVLYCSVSRHRHALGESSACFYVMACLLVCVCVCVCVCAHNHLPDANGAAGAIVKGGRRSLLVVGLRC